MTRQKDQTTTTLSIPFPAWEGIFNVASICEELRRNETLKGIAVHRTPRRITIQEKGAREGFEDSKAVEYWFTDGCYATMTIGGNDGHYGWSWTIISLRLRWKDHSRSWSYGDETKKLNLNREQVAAISLTAYLRANLYQHEECSGTLPAAQAYLAENEAKSDTLIAELAGPIEEAWQAVLAERASRMFEAQ